MFDASHSTKLPMSPIRKLAGFLGDMCFNTRTVVEVEEALLKATPIGKWLCNSLDGVREAASNGN